MHSAFPFSRSVARIYPRFLHLIGPPRRCCRGIGTDGGQQLGVPHDGGRPAGDPRGERGAHGAPEVGQGEG
eukprot:4217941-Pyramimonas_sp.AAC.1